MPKGVVFPFLCFSFMQGLGKPCVFCGDGISDLAAVSQVGIRRARTGWGLDGHAKSSKSRQLTCTSAHFSISCDDS